MLLARQSFKLIEFEIPDLDETMLPMSTLANAKSEISA